ncbi:hypothetical protein GCM10010169_23320 [Micromonospora fulviviridis]|uniref:hypothetical protein n=1 Tax=Micromonospora fulviviridis TaxID=47860 RepID=UPI0016674E61|nr:hypothetical protein [Micromonospora fulviviridis]GGR78477.1 hypothetical protein GCM10010169_23320 [Micromonospora fulviviridis]
MQNADDQHDEVDEWRDQERRANRTFVPGEDGYDARAAEVEEWLNERMGPRWMGWYPQHSKVPGAAMFAQTKQSESGRWVLTGLLLLGEAITAEQLRKVPVSALENSTNLSAGDAFDQMRAELDKLPPLRRDDMAPEDFSRLVAEHFKVWARYVPHPAAAMAAEWKVKPPTVHTWIREARLRGHLPPARRGKST